MIRHKLHILTALRFIVEHGNWKRSEWNVMSKIYIFVVYAWTISSSHSFKSRTSDLYFAANLTQGFSFLELTTFLTNSKITLGDHFLSLFVAIFCTSYTIRGWCDKTKQANCPVDYQQFSIWQRSATQVLSQGTYLNIVRNIKSSRKWLNKYCFWWTWFLSGLLFSSKGWRQISKKQTGL